MSKDKRSEYQMTDSSSKWGVVSESVQSPDRVEDILKIADRVRERTTPETFETVFNAVLRVVYPK